MVPGSGATLRVEECQYYPSRLDLNFWEMCADHLDMTFTGEVPRAVANAVVTAAFYNGTQRCGMATSPSRDAAAQAGNLVIATGSCGRSRRAGKWPAPRPKHFT